MILKSVFAKCLVLINGSFVTCNPSAAEVSAINFLVPKAISL